jgi:hypothetical protein
MYTTYRLLAVALIVLAVVVGRRFASWDKVLLITASWTAFFLLLYKVLRGRRNGDS